MSNAIGPGAARVEKSRFYHFTPREAEAFLADWWRVVAADDSTIAYMPDKPTEKRIAHMIKKGT